MGLSMNDGIQGMFIFFHKTGSNFLHFPQTLEYRSAHHLHFKADYAWNL